VLRGNDVRVRARMTETTALLWPMPELDDRPQPPPMPMEARSQSDDGAVDPWPTAEADAPSPAELVEQQLARGYATGWERGFAEGRDIGLTQGREQGYADGFATGAEAARADLAAEADRLRSIVGRLGAPIPALDAIVEDAVAALALEVARCVIGRETSTSRDYLVPLIRDAIAQIPIEMGAPKLMLNPADLDTIRKTAADIVRDGAVLVADDAVEPGDCRVICDGERAPIKDRRWRPRPAAATAQADLSLAARWRAAIFAMFEGEDQ
jgi:flagellar assembly protein FliH